MMSILGKFFKNFVVVSVIVFLFAGLLWIIVLIRGDFTTADYSGRRKQLANHFCFKKIIAEREKTKRQAKAMHLSFYEPASFSDLAQYVRNPGLADRGNLEVYKIYYEKAAEFFPQMAEVHGMLGFIYYHLGDSDKALNSYRNALRLNPYFFWFHYNLGLLYFQNGQYDKAAILFAQALKTNQGLNLKIIYNSSVYRPIFASAQNWGDYPVEENIKQGYKDCHLLLNLSQKRQQDASSQPPTEKIVIRLF